VRDFVLGARLINGLGEHLTFGGQVIKNVAGYDLSRLLCGSWGTLGLITEVSLKVLPLAPAEATLHCSGVGQAAALALLHRWGGQPLPLNASCWLHDTSASPAADHLYVRLRGASAAVQTAIPRMLGDMQAAGGAAQQMDNTQAMADWRACADQTLPFFTQSPTPQHALWRLSLPQTAPVLNLPYPVFVEWQGAHSQRPRLQVVMPPCSVPAVLAAGPIKRLAFSARCHRYNAASKPNCSASSTRTVCLPPGAWASAHKDHANHPLPRIRWNPGRPGR
jgi:hypothetical protein